MGGGKGCQGSLSMSMAWVSRADRVINTYRGTVPRGRWQYEDQLVQREGGCERVRIRWNWTCKLNSPRNEGVRQ
jgi:hypothetical protein